MQDETVMIPAELEVCIDEMQAESAELQLAIGILPDKPELTKGEQQVLRVMVNRFEELEAVGRDGVLLLLPYLKNLVGYVPGIRQTVADIERDLDLEATANRPREHKGSLICEYMQMVGDYIRFHTTPAGRNATPDTFSGFTDQLVLQSLPADAPSPDAMFFPNHLSRMFRAAFTSAFFSTPHSLQ